MGKKIKCFNGNRAIEEVATNLAAIQIEFSKTDWGAAKAFAFGELGLLPKEYYALTHLEYNLMCKGYFIRQQNEKLRKKKLLRSIKWAIKLGAAVRSKLDKGDER